MKTWQKMIIVCVSGAIVWGLSYTISIRPEMAMVLSTVNTSVVAICTFFTGFAKTEV
jgi:hypothetical protein